MAYKEITIETMDDLFKVLNDIREQKGKEHPVWYRGQQNSNWELIPSIHRNVLINKERYLVNDFYIKVKQIQDNTPDKENFAAWMSLMQHYGLPTRILDWSESPVISLFFATEDNAGTQAFDACLWVLMPRMINVMENFGEYVYPMDSYSSQRLIIQAFKDVEIEEMFQDKILACHSVEKDLRMYTQRSGFTIHNTQRKLVDICTNDMLYKIVIPSYKKKYFYNCVEALGITPSFIYPTMEQISKDVVKRFMNE